MRQSGVDTLITEEPDDRIGHVRICGGDGQQWSSLPGILPIPYFWITVTAHETLLHIEGFVYNIHHTLCQILYLSTPLL